MGLRREFIKVIMLRIECSLFKNWSFGLEVKDKMVFNSRDGNVYRMK